MIDLREKIQQKVDYYSQTHEKAYEKMCKEIDTSLIEMHEVGEYEGQKIAYENCLNFLNQYNVITTPKTINLSEIIKKLEKDLDEYIHVNKQGSIISVYYKQYDFEDEAYYIEVFTIDENMQIKDVYLSSVDTFKWFYTLWISGIKIIDDMEA